MGVFCNGSTPIPEGHNGTKEGATVSCPVAVLQNPSHQNASHLELASLSTGLRIDQDTRRSSVLSRSSTLRFAQDLTEKQPTPLHHCIDGAEWDDIWSVGFHETPRRHQFVLSWSAPIHSIVGLPRS